MENADQKTYWAKEMAEFLSVGTSTLRKYCLRLEQNGYVFLRDEHDRRAFTEHDAIALRQLKEYVKSGMSMENAVNAVVSRFKRDENDLITLSASSLNERLRERDIQEIKEYFNERFNQQEQFNQELLKRLDRQQEYIENSLERRDRELMNALKDTLETQKMLAAAAEEKKSWLQKLFKK